MEAVEVLVVILRPVLVLMEKVEQVVVDTQHQQQPVVLILL